MALCGCADIDDTEYADDANDPELPPRGPIATTRWLADGHYLAWHCEASAHPPSAQSPHDRNRICSNDALSTAPDGPFPLGAASVKELFDGDRLMGYALTRKVELESRGARAGIGTKRSLATSQPPRTTPIRARDVTQKRRATSSTRSCIRPRSSVYSARHGRVQDCRQGQAAEGEIQTCAETRER